MRLPQGYGRRRPLSVNLARIALALLLIPIGALLTLRDYVRKRAPTSYALLTSPMLWAVLIMLSVLELWPIGRG